MGGAVYETCSVGEVAQDVGEGPGERALEAAFRDCIEDVFDCVLRRHEILAECRLIDAGRLKDGSSGSGGGH